MEGETVIAVLLGAALAVFSLVMVAYSFFRGNETAAPSPSPAQAVDEDGVGLDSIYDSIDTLELEYQLGNLPEDQYREQLRAYRLEAAAAIKNQLEGGAAPADLLLEQEVMAARAEIRSTNPAAGWQACPQCDAPIPAALAQSDGSCPHCGASFSSPLPGIDSAETSTDSGAAQQ